MKLDVQKAGIQCPICGTPVDAAEAMTKGQMAPVVIIDPCQHTVVLTLSDLP